MQAICRNNLLKLLLFLCLALGIEPIFARTKGILASFEQQTVASNISVRGVFDRDYKVLVVKDTHYNSIVKFMRSAHQTELGDLLGLKTSDGYHLSPVKEYIKNLLLELPKSEQKKFIEMYNSPRYQITDLIDLMENTTNLKALIRQPYRVFSKTFIHGNGIHLGLNLLGLYKMYAWTLPNDGANIALDLLFSTIGSSISSAIVHPHNNSVGASGAIYGVIGYIQSQEGVSPEDMATIFAKGAIFSEAMTVNSEHKIDHIAHFSGLASGILFQNFGRQILGPTSISISSKLVLGTYASLSIFPYICSWFVKNNFKFEQKFLGNPYPGIALKLRSISHLN